MLNILYFCNSGPCLNDLLAKKNTYLSIYLFIKRLAEFFLLLISQQNILSFTWTFLHGPALFRTALPHTDGLSLGERWDAVTWCIFIIIVSIILECFCDYGLPAVATGVKPWLLQEVLQFVGRINTVQYVELRGVLPMRVGGATSQLDLPFIQLTQIKFK